MKCFVISPIGEEDSDVRAHADEVFSHIIAPALSSFNIEPVRSDHMNEPGRISEQMYRAIFDYDLCIAVLTFANPNVYYELAVAQSASRPVIILIEKGTSLPFDVKDFRTLTYDLSISSYNKRTHIDRLKMVLNELKANHWKGDDVFKDYRQAEILSPAHEHSERLRKLGVVTAFPARSVPIRPEYSRRFTASREQIDICGFGLRALREDFLPEFRSWLKHTRVRILLIDPLAPAPEWRYTKQRDLEEGNVPGQIEKDVYQFLRVTLPIKRDFPESFDVRVYRCIPAINICRIDKEAFWGPYLLGEQSRNTPTILVDSSGVFFRVLADHYDKIWLDDNYSQPAYGKLVTGEITISLDMQQENA